MEAQRQLHYSRTVKDLAVSSASQSPRRVKEADVSNLLDIIEGQRQSLEQRAEIINTLQSDVGALGQKLMEERSRANHNNSLYKAASKELEALKSLTTTAGNTPREDPQLLRTQFQLHSDLDNLQHLLDVRTREVADLRKQLERPTDAELSEDSLREEEGDTVAELLQSQIGWLKKENEKLVQESWEKEGKVQRLQKRLKQVESEAKQGGETIAQMGIEAQNRATEIERKNREIRELREKPSYVQLPTQKSYVSRGPVTEEDLRSQISSFKSQAISIAGRLSSVHRDKSQWEERLKSQQAKRQQLSSSVDIIRRQLEDEQVKRRTESDTLEQYVQSLSADLERVNAEKTTAKTQLEGIRAEMRLAKEEMERAQGQTAQLARESSTLQRELNECKLGRKQAQKTVIRLEAELTAAEVHTADYSQVRQDNSRLRKQLAEAESQIKGLKEQLLAAESQCEYMEKELTAGKRVKLQWEAGLGDLEKEMKSVESMTITCRQLQKTVETLTEAKQRLEAIVSST